MPKPRSKLVRTLFGSLLFLVITPMSYVLNGQIPTPDFRLLNSGFGRPAASPARPDPALVIDNFIAAETRFRKAMLQYSFKRDVVLQTVGAGGEVTGEYLRSSSFVLDDRGQRVEQVFFHPPSTIKSMKITKEDVQDLAGSQLFGLEPDEMGAYNFSYAGQENLHGQAVYAVDVRPRQEPNPQQMRARFFVGKIWIDALSYQIVKLEGITEPHGKQRFPTFTTERSLKVDDLLFPSKTFADDVLRFPQVEIRYRIAVRYYEFKRFASELKIVEVE